jgi:hypothetical protein
MKKLTVIGARILGLSALAVLAQDEGGPPPGDGARPARPHPPLLTALDANGDGVIDAQEIANASAALKQLDKNGDGKLTVDELRPPRREGQAGPMRQERRQGRGGRQGPPPPPLIHALDANHDGVIDAQELANAPEALKQLDKNNDGQLTREELMPPRPAGRRGPGGWGRGRPPGNGDQPQDGVPPQGPPPGE